MKTTTRESLERYAEHGIPTGGFLRAVLCNDLFEAVGSADDDNRHNIHEICMYVYNEMPYSCWGDEATVDAWIAAKRLQREPAEFAQAANPVMPDQCPPGAGIDNTTRPSRNSP